MDTKVTIGYDARNKRKPYIVRWYGEYDPTTGKQSRYGKSFRIKVDAEQFAAEKTVDFSKGGLRDGLQDVTVEQFCKDWLKANRAQLRPSSIRIYENTHTRLKGYFGQSTHIKTITPQKAAAFVAEQKNRSKVKLGEVLSDGARQQVRCNCKRMFSEATRWGLLYSNPFDGLKGKKVISRRWHKVTAQEYHALLAASPNMRWQAFYALCYTAGLRLSEAMNLLWSDIDFEHGRVIVANREANLKTSPFRVKDHEKREIPLPQHSVDLFTKWQQEAPEGVPYICLTAERYQIVKTKLVKFRKEGKAWQNQFLVNCLLREFKRHYKWAGIKPVHTLNIHTLRKSCCQNWVDGGLPMNVVKELMGHADISTTAAFYNQVDADHERKAASVIQGLLEQGKRRHDMSSDVEKTYEQVSDVTEGAK